MSGPEEDSQPQVGSTRKSGRSSRNWSALLRSLPARISLFVLVSTLVASSTVTLLSVMSMDSFLRAKIDRKYPSILASASEKLDLWYDGRELEMGVFSGSRVMQENLEQLSKNPNGRRSQLAREEIDQYLTHVSRSFPQYTAVFAFDAEGEVVASVGQTVALSPDLRQAMRERAADADAAPIYSLTPRQQVATGDIVRSTV